mmetsp:Transcript_25542/g.70319  ORF Transcript_25542/g.70319 Transcript_25542/m.70319 type:complete len:116 (+) Transcript_25542:3942-4289(+)
MGIVIVGSIAVRDLVIGAALTYITNCALVSRGVGAKRRDTDSTLLIARWCEMTRHPIHGRKERVIGYKQASTVAASDSGVLDGLIAATLCTGPLRARINSGLRFLYIYIIIESLA